jgi:hypothetical protein
MCRCIGALLAEVDFRAIDELVAQFIIVQRPGVRRTLTARMHQT